ncbi:LOB domain-containing protein 27 [Euphorbia peplus]|nr:LOB domain-containing protein 27 [Euphorbia peplus]
MTLKGGSSQACAACKYQRRKCSAECPLAPYFPPDQTKMFQNAHKLFGVRNIIKILEKLDATRKQEAMRSIIYQSYIRDRYPVHGCLGVINQLQFQIKQTLEELHAVNTQLEMYRQNHQHMSSLADDVASQLVLGMAPPTSTNPFHLFPISPVSDHHSSNSGINLHHSKNSLWVNYPYATAPNPTPTTSNGNNTNSIHSQPLPIHQVAPDYDAICPFFYTNDDRQWYIESKEGYESSLEESVKDTTQSIELVGENELKNAAACFSLTSVNS